MPQIVDGTTTVRASHLNGKEDDEFLHDAESSGVTDGVLRMTELADHPTNAAGIGMVYTVGGEVYAQDEDGNQTPISPHAFPKGMIPSHRLAWVARTGTRNDRVAVDMFLLAATLQQISGVQLLYTFAQGEAARPLRSPGFWVWLWSKITRRALPLVEE